MSNIWHELPSDLSKLICAYVGTDRIKPWVKALGPIYWDWLSMNSSAIDLLKANLDKINWDWLSTNPAALNLIESNFDKIDWNWLSSNPAIFEPEADHFTLLMQVIF